ncbi:MAG: SDR family oxidoreductase [Gordonia sp. (in: high G+C Gram-positive bacteria)]|uniref:SDR family oxidoreductase n=1 Tax=Gordonia sp. (in: high G+C Gram-positive bacteria) TaxID=84139 RepID=UPI003BB7CDC4
MATDTFRLDGQVAIITGAGRGLGAAIARGLAEAGADVVISARTADDLEQVAAEIGEIGRRAVVVPLNLVADDPAPLIEAAIAEFGRLDIVVNNVGGAMPKPFLDTSVRELVGSFAFNVGTAHGLLLAAVPHLLAGDGGSVINITSSIGRLSDRGYLTYGTVKAALTHYTELAAQDLSPRIRVNAIAPGAVHTAALDWVAADETMRGQIEAATPMRRLGLPEEIAAAAVYLASPAAAYVTGTVLAVDGGITAPNFRLPLPDLS